MFLRVLSLRVFSLLVLLSIVPQMASAQDLATNLDALNSDIAAVRQQQVRLQSSLQRETQDRRRIQGDLEVIGNRLKQLEKRFDGLVSALDGRLQELEDILRSQQNEQQTVDASEASQTEPQKTAAPQVNDVQAGDSIAPDTTSTTTEAVVEKFETAVENTDLAAKETVKNTNSNNSLGQLSVDADGQTTGATVVKERTFADRYDEAIQFIRQGTYREARTILQALTAEDPEHALSSNVLYWLGETYYVEEDYKNAMSNFARSAQKYPDGAKYFDSLLKIGLSLGSIERMESACNILTDLGKDGTTLPNDIALKRRNALDRFGCKS